MKKCLLFFILMSNIAFAEMYRIPVSERADSADLAKETAMNNARKSVVETVISNKLGYDNFLDTKLNLSDSDIQSMIMSISIENERISDTLYEAELYISTADKEIEKFLQKQNLVNNSNQNLNMTKQYYVFDVNGLRSWTKIRNVMNLLKANNVNMNIESITGISAKMYANTKDTEIIKQTLWNDGFSINDMGGFLKIK